MKIRMIKMDQTYETGQEFKVGPDDMPMSIAELYVERGAAVFVDDTPKAADPTPVLPSVSDVAAKVGESFAHRKHDKMMREGSAKTK